MMNRPVPVQPGIRFKQLVLLTGAVYLGLVCVTNTVNLVGTLTGRHWVLFDSGNASYIASIGKPYGLPHWFADTAVLGALLVEGIGAGLFIRALHRYRGGTSGQRAAWTALTWNVAVWLAFIVGTELLVAYPSEGPFRELLACALLMATAFAVVPD